MAMIFTLVMREDFEIENPHLEVIHTLGAASDKIREIEDLNLEDDEQTYRLYTTQIMALSSLLLDAGWQVDILGARGDYVRIYYGMDLGNGETLTQPADLRKLLLHGMFGDFIIFEDE